MPRNETGPYVHIGEKAIKELTELIRNNKKASRLLNRLETDEYVQGVLEMANTVVVGRMGYNDHGLTHARIVARNAVTILRLLNEAGIRPNIVRERVGDFDDAEAIVMTAAYIHDMGNAIHREIHYIHSTILAEEFLSLALDQIYGNDKKKWAKLKTQALSAIYTHDEAVDAISVEGGCVKVGDGTDMACGRARVPFSKGKKDIHSISALAIDDVKIVRGDEKPVRIEVAMSCSAGVFQIQNVLGGKIRTSSIKEYLEVIGVVNARDKDQIFDRIEL